MPVSECIEHRSLQMVRKGRINKHNIERLTSVLGEKTFCRAAFEHQSARVWPAGNHFSQRRGGIDILFNQDDGRRTPRNRFNTECTRPGKQVQTSTAGNPRL